MAIICTYTYGGWTHTAACTFRPCGFRHECLFQSAREKDSKGIVPLGTKILNLIRTNISNPEADITLATALGQHLADAVVGLMGHLSAWRHVQN